MKIPHKTLEKKLLFSGHSRIIAVDEVGMGCLAGPVVVCAVILDKKFFKKSHRKLHWLRDSKLLLPHQREEFAEELLKESNIKFAICYCHPKTIDRLNIYQAARVAMRRAIRKLAADSSVVVLVDGKSKIEGIPFEQRAIVKGDRKVFSIACASILAKVFRDKMMVRYAKKFPGYGFEKHKGYGTAEHKISLAVLGPCPIHRRSFARLNFWTSENNKPWLGSLKV